MGLAEDGPRVNPLRGSGPATPRGSAPDPVRGLRPRTPAPQSPEGLDFWPLRLNRRRGWISGPLRPKHQRGWTSGPHAPNTSAA